MSIQIYNTLSKRKEELSLRAGQGKNVCLRTYRIQPDPYRKCPPMIVLYIRAPLHGMQGI